ncbi:hypothetical protein OC846_004819 [Tilletia horrida]|uniref:Uncharacterized protein n=1 Tax=Tilletia horrida TaxID=155126 RepID=A0AAN6GMK8_9BASI|nr:hypothetical protein OC845_004947 [Tilletia horrida]KAK0547513.1 hypothetical protein OC846_004819 [Tilletia horrida]
MFSTSKLISSAVVLVVLSCAYPTTAAPLGNSLLNFGKGSVVIPDIDSGIFHYEKPGAVDNTFVYGPKGVIEKLV